MAAAPSDQRNYDAATDVPLGALYDVLSAIEKNVNNYQNEALDRRDERKGTSHGYYSHADVVNAPDVRRPFSSAFHEVCDCRKDWHHGDCQVRAAFKAAVVDVSKFCRECDAYCGLDDDDAGKMALALHALAIALAPFAHVDNGDDALNELRWDANYEDYGFSNDVVKSTMGATADAPRTEPDARD